MKQCIFSTVLYLSSAFLSPRVTNQLSTQTKLSLVHGPLEKHGSLIISGEMNIQQCAAFDVGRRRAALADRIRGMSSHRYRVGSTIMMCGLEMSLSVDVRLFGMIGEGVKRAGQW